MKVKQVRVVDVGTIKPADALRAGTVYLRQPASRSRLVDVLNPRRLGGTRFRGAEEPDPQHVRFALERSCRMPGPR